MTNFNIQEVSSPEDRNKLHKLFNDNITYLLPDAIPNASYDSIVMPTMFIATDSKTKDVAGGIYTSIPNPVFHEALIGGNIYTPHKDKIRFLDYIAVDSKHRKNNLGTTLLKKVEDDLRSQGIKILYGEGEINGMRFKELKRFYEVNGYTVVGSSNLPKFYDLDWSTSGIPFYFYKNL